MVRVNCDQLLIDLLRIQSNNKVSQNYIFFHVHVFECEIIILRHFYLLLNVACFPSFPLDVIDHNYKCYYGKHLERMIMNNTVKYFDKKYINKKERERRLPGYCQ